MNWANRLTIFRIILVPVFITAIFYNKLIFALIVFCVAALTDAADGYIARRRNEKTSFGAIIDPIADKFLIGAAFISLSLVSTLPDYIRIPVYVPIIIISRDVIILMGIMMLYLTVGQIEIKPTIVSKVTTVFQMVTIISVLLGFSYSFVIWNVATILTIISGLDYIRIGSKYVSGLNGK